MNDSMRVLVISNRYPTDRKPYAGMFVRRHVLLHIQGGLEVKVLTHEGNRRGWYGHLWNYLLFLGAIAQATLFWNFEIIHSHWVFPSGLFGFVISSIRKRPLIVTSHGAYIDDYETRSYLTRHIIKIILRHAKVIFAVGSGHKQRIETISGLPPNRVKYLPMGVWSNNSISKLEARASLGLDQKSSILIFLGNLEKVKGPDILIRAIAELQSKLKDLIVLICGQGPEELNLYQLVSKFNLDNIVKMIGGIHPDSVSCWLSAADLCIIPSRREAFGLVALEAMACGTPVIAARVGGLEENIVHGQNGFLFPKEDYLGLAEQIDLALRDRLLREEMIMNGLRTAAKFDMAAQAEEVRQVYFELTSPGLISAR